MRLPLLALTFAVSLPSFAADPAAATQKTPVKAKAKTKPRPRTPLFEMPSLGEVPKADGAVRSSSSEDALGSRTRTAASDAQYSVVKVSHAKAFAGGAPSGAQPVGKVLDQVKIKGTPAQTEKFASVIRVKSSQRVGAAIDVVLLDPAGNTALSASGELSWRGLKTDEAEWIVDWDPSPVRGPGKYSVLVRIAGQPMGTWPLTVVTATE